MTATAEAVVFAEQSGDDLALDLARSTRGVVLLHHDGPGRREEGLGLLLTVGERALNQQFTLTTLPVTDIHIAGERARSGDLNEACAAVERLAAVKVDPRFIVHELFLLRLRGLLAHARGDEVSYQDLRDSYRKLANDLCFDGYMKWAEAMT